MEMRIFSERGAYRTTYLAFIDILGFKNVLYSNCLKSPNYLLRILSAADSAVRRDEWHGIHKMFLSDSIVLWTHDRFAIPFLIENCETVQERLFIEGHLVRGAIVKDNHYSGDIESYNTRLDKRLSFPNHVIVSPAMTKAFQAEEHFEEPFIKAEGAVLNDVPKKLRSVSARKKHYQPRKFYDGRDYCGHFTYLFQLVKSKNKPWKRELIKEFRRVMDLRDMVQANLHKLKGRAREKWKFVGRRFNSFSAQINATSTDKRFFIPQITLPND